jgi:hypothetical protein
LGTNGKVQLKGGSRINTCWLDLGESEKELVIL